MSTSIHSILPALCLAAGLCGCQTSSSVNTVSSEPSATRQMVPDKRIITDKNLESKIHVVGINEAPAAGGLRRIQVEVLNRTHEPQRINYAFEWFDTDGMLVSPTSTALIQCVIEGGETRMLSSLAPTPACKDFRIKFIAGTP